MSEFVNYLHEVFESFGPISSRKMFGGYGIYHDGLMFGLVADDELFLKVDDQSRAQFEARGLDAFEYVKKDGKSAKMSYHRAPEEIFDDPDEAKTWAMIAFDAALRARKPRKQ